MTLRLKSFLSFKMMESLLNSLHWKAIKISSTLLILSLYTDITFRELEQNHNQYLKDLDEFITPTFICVSTCVLFSPPVNILPDLSFALFHWYCICEIQSGKPWSKSKSCDQGKVMYLNSRTYRY